MLINIVFPTNLVMTSSILINLAQFDILEEDGICDVCQISIFFHENSERESRYTTETPNQIIYMGYESYSRIDNAGSLSLFAILYVFKVLTIILFYIMTYTVNGERHKKRLH